MSSTTSATQPHYTLSGNLGFNGWYVPPKHCGGMTKCGKACHKGVNLVILKWVGDKIKAYCKECDEFIEEGEVSKECHD